MKVTGSRSHKSYAATLWLALLGGAFGAHRFYAGKVGTGILYLFTLGFFFIGQFVDILTVAFGNFTDKSGHFIRPQRRSESGETMSPTEAAVESDNTSAKKKIPTWVWIVSGVLVFGLILQSCGEDSSPPAAEQEQQILETPQQGEPEPVEPEDAPEPEPEPEGGSAAGSEVCEEGKLGNMWVLLEEENCIDPWPLTSRSGILYCDPYGEGLDVVVWNPDEDPLEYYALNGMASGQGFPDIEPFWKDTPAGSPAPKVNIGAMIDAGLSLCN